MRECEKEERARGRKIERGREREIIREAISERDRKEDNSTYKARQHSIPIKVQNR